MTQNKPLVDTTTNPHQNIPRLDMTYLFSLSSLLLTYTIIIYFESLLIETQNVNNGDKLLVPPIVINTWNFTDANQRAWLELAARHSAIDAIEAGCTKCEEERCDGTVGWGGSPSEKGETTLDAMIMDGETFDVGAVAGLRRIKEAISVARYVMERTKHTLLVGYMATQFAISLGFKEQSLSSNESRSIHKQWLAGNCQPNYWENVVPDPTTSCGPYKPAGNEVRIEHSARPGLIGHDTIGMIAMDYNKKLASGTSTNGLRHKISGRVGDSPVPGAGSYASRDSGAAAATGDGDVIMRFLLSYQAVENLRLGMKAKDAAVDVIKRQIDRTGRPYPQAAVVVLGKNGDYGAACSGFKQFPYVVSDSKRQSRTLVADCFD